MLIYALQSFTAIDGTACTAKNTYTLTDTAAQNAIMSGQAQIAEMPNYIASPAFAEDSSGIIKGLRNPVSGGIVDSTGYLDIRAYGAKCDGQAVYDGVVSNGAGAYAGKYKMVSATGTFAASDIGKGATLTKLAAGTNFGYDTVITDFIDRTTVYFTSGAAPSATTSYMYVWGTDDSAAVKAACTAAGANGSRGTVFFPNAITCMAAKVTVPNGVTLRGVAGNSMADEVWAMRPSGSYIVPLKFYSGYVFDFGATLNGGAVMAYDLTVDAMNLLSGGIQDISKGNTKKNVACIRGTAKTMISGGSAVLESCVIAGQQRGIAFRQVGDSRAVNNYIYGAAVGSATVEIQGQDILFSHNHLWRDGDVDPAGDLVQVKCDGTGSNSDGEITICANKFDTPVGACVYVKITGSGVIRTLNIVDNGSITNDGVQLQPSATFSGSITTNVLTVASVSAGTIYTGALLSGGTVGAGVRVGAQLSGTMGGAGTYTCVGADATGITTATGYPYIILDIAAGCTLRMLNVVGNTGFGSWATPYKSPYACFIDGSRNLGAVLVANVQGNAIDNCGAGYSNFAAGTNLGGGTVGVLNSANNYVIPNTNATTVGTTPVAF